MAFFFIGLSQVRESNVFGGLPLVGALTAGRATHTNYMRAPASATAAVTVGVLLLFAGTLGRRDYLGCFDFTLRVTPASPRQVEFVD